MTTGHVALTVAAALAAGIFVQCLARVVRIPSIVMLLATGLALGPTGLDWVRPEDLGEGLFLLVDFAVAVILFEGALNLDLSRLRREERVIRRLLTEGAFVTFVGSALAVWLLLEWSLSLSVLVGALVVVTGPTVVGPLVRDLRLRPRIQTILEAEGVLIDPIGALLALLVLQVTLTADAVGVAAEAWDLVLRLVFGIVFGVAGGLAIAGLLRVPALVRGLENVLTLALVTLLFQLGDYALSQTGLLAVTVAGLVVGNVKSPVAEDLREFKDQLTVLLIGAIFVLLAANVDLADVQALGLGGIAVVVVLVVVVRPVSVLVATRASGLTWRERMFIAAIAPRGIVAAAVASITASVLTAEGLPGGNTLTALVFLTIGGTVLAAGVLAWPLAAILGLRLPARDRVVILGAQGLGLALGQQLRAAGRTVVFIDADPKRCREAEEMGFSVLFGDALSDRVLRRIPIELVGTAVGATFNDNLNSQFVRLARQAFGVKHGLVSVDALSGGRPPTHVARHGSDVLFDGQHDQERWDVRWRQKQVETARFEFTPPSATEVATASGDLFAILTIERSRRAVPMSLSYKLRKGDLATVAIHSRSREQAVAQLSELGWHELPDSESSADAVPVTAPIVP